MTQQQQMDVRFSQDNTSGQTVITIDCNSKQISSKSMAKAEKALAINRDKHHTQELLKSTPASLQEIGTEIFNLLFASEQEQSFYQQATQGQSSLRLIIHENNHAPDIPWELAHDGSSFLCRSRRVELLRSIADEQPLTDKPATQEQEQEQETQEKQTPLKLLFFTAQPENAGQTMAEKLQVGFARAVAGLFRDNLLEVTEEHHCTKQRLSELLANEQFDIICFFGHGYAPKAGNDGGIVLENSQHQADYLSAKQFADMLFDKPPTLCMFNACSSAAMEQSAGAANSRFRDVARELANCGVPLVLASQAVVYVDVAIGLIGYFFSALREQLLSSTKNTSSASSASSVRLDYYPALRIAREKLAAEKPANEKSLVLNNSFYQYVAITGATGAAAFTVSVPPNLPERAIIRARFSGKFGLTKPDFVPRNQIAAKMQSLANQHQHLGVYGVGGLGKTSFARLWYMRMLQTSEQSLRVDDAIWLDMSETSTQGKQAVTSQILDLIERRDPQKPADIRESENRENAMINALRVVYGGKILLLVDNAESLLESTEQQQITSFLAKLLDLTGWQSLWTSREKINLPHSHIEWQALDGFNRYEIAALLLVYESQWQAICQPLDQATQDRLESAVFKSIAVHPHALVLFLHHAQSHPHQGKDTWQSATMEELADYAKISFYINKCTDRQLALMRLLALCQQPVPDFCLSLLVGGVQPHLDFPAATEQQHGSDKSSIIQAALVETDSQHLWLLPVIEHELLQGELKHWHKVLADTSLAIAEQCKQQASELSQASEAKQLQELRSWFMHLASQQCLQQNDWSIIAAVTDQLDSDTHGVSLDQLFGFADRLQQRLQSAGKEIEQEVVYALTLNTANLFLRARYLTEALSVSRYLLDQYPEHKHKGTVLHHMGIVYQQQRQWHEALSSYQQAIEAEQSSGMAHQIGTTLHQMGMVYQEQRQWPEALSSYQQAIEAKQSSGMAHEIGATRHQMGIVYQEQRQWPEALSSYQQAIEANQSSGMAHQIGGTRHQMGIVYQEQRQWHEALSSYQQAIEANQSSGMAHQIGGTRHQMGIVYQEQRQWHEALSSYQQAIEAFQSSGMAHQIGGTRHQMGRVYEEQRQWHEALSSYQQAIEANQSSGMAHQIGTTRHQMGIVYQQQRQWHEALSSYQQAIEAKQSSGMAHEIGGTLHQMGRVYEEQRQWHEALDYSLRGLEAMLRHPYNPEHTRMALAKSKRLLEQVEDDDLHQRFASLRQEFAEQIAKLEEQTGADGDDATKQFLALIQHISESNQEQRQEIIQKITTSPKDTKEQLANMLAMLDQLSPEQCAAIQQQIVDFSQIRTMLLDAVQVD